MKFNYLKISILLLITHNVMLGYPRGLHALRVAAGIRSQLSNHPHSIQKRHIAAEAALFTAASVSPAAPILAAGICVGAACWGLSSFFEFYYGNKFVSAATKKAIKQALHYDKANAEKALQMVKETTMSFEDAYAKVYQINQQAEAIAAQSGESVNAVYKRLIYAQASPEVKCRMDQEALQEQARQIELARKMQNSFSSTGGPVKTEPPASVVTPPAQTIVAATPEAAKSAGEFFESTDPINEVSGKEPFNPSITIVVPEGPSHTGHTAPLPDRDNGCRLPPPSPRDPPAGFGGVEEPKSTIICAFPAVEKSEPTFFQNDLLNELLEGENEAIKEILKDTIPGRETRGSSTQRIRVGGTYEDALKDFEKIGLSGVKDIPGKEGKIGYLPDGKTVNVRADSTYKTPSLEVYNPVNEQKVKIRYEKQ